jgi:glycosyltransferase involved in cell wall biosynthesis
MRLLFVADGRSAIALNWITYFIDRKDEVHLVTTFDCSPDLDFASVNFVPVAFSQSKKNEPLGSRGNRREGLLWSSSLVKIRTSIRRILFPLTIPSAVNQLREIIADIQPDLVHALRIPFEGILAARALRETNNPPLIISVWGNDFTLHAGATPWMKSYTELAMARTDGLHTDCHRDLRLAYQWGYRDDRPAIVVPGNGGIHTDLFYPPNDDSSSRSNMVINPRGVRSYIRNDTFFAAIPHVLARLPQTKFICLGMEGEIEVQKWIDKLEIGSAVELLPYVPRAEMAELFRSSAITVSPSVHDGTPNTLLEAMACGCYPIAGDLESIREWIEPGINGSLIDPADPVALAEAVINALENYDLRQKTAEYNRELISERAEYQSSMARALEFFQAFIQNE